MGLKVPDTYVRIYSIKTYPKGLQRELLIFPSAIYEDSDYEEDPQVLKNYRDNPVEYIQKNS